MIQQLLLIAHVLIAIGIIALVLIQRGKGAEAGAAFGSGASGTMFGARGSASFLTRSTSVLATGFFATSLALAFFANQPRTDLGGSVIGDEPAAMEELPGEAALLPTLEDGGAGLDEVLPQAPVAPEEGTENNQR